MWDSVVNNTDVEPRIDERNSANLGELHESNNISNLTYTKNTIPSHRGMVIACLNINSLIAHIDELRIFISNTKIDILCVNETKLDPSINDREVYLVGHEIVRRDRKVNGRNGGRVCIYIRSNINYQVRDDLHSATLENLVVEIKKPRSKSVLVSTWYRPPDSPMSQFIEFEKMIGSFDAENVEYFLLGDLNVDLISTTESPTKNKLKEILDIYGIEQLINQPTRITISSRTLIDLCLTNTPTHTVKTDWLK